MRTTGNILRAVQAGNIEPVYFLLGEEYYLQHLIIEHIGKLYLIATATKLYVRGGVLR